LLKIRRQVSIKKDVTALEKTQQLLAQSENQKEELRNEVRTLKKI
jgi:hypothetical protein